WHHVAVVKAGNIVNLYVDGVQENTETVSTAAQNNSLPLLIGLNPPGEGGIQHWKGAIDDGRIWSVARSAQDIAADMVHLADLHETGLAAYWDLEEGQGSVAHDVTGNGSDGTLTAEGASLPAWVASTAPIFPSNAQVSVHANDGRGGSDAQSFTIQLVPAPTL